MLPLGSYKVTGGNAKGWVWQGHAIVTQEDESLKITEYGYWITMNDKNIHASRTIFFTKEKITIHNGFAAHAYPLAQTHSNGTLAGTYTCPPDAYATTFTYDITRHTARLTQSITGPAKNDNLWWEYTLTTQKG